jgi:hypothetical protein
MKVHESFWNLRFIFSVLLDKMPLWFKRARDLIENPTPREREVAIFNGKKS